MRRYGLNNMENIVVRYAKREELESVNKIRKQVNEVHVKGRPDVFREDGWRVIEPFVYIQDLKRKTAEWLWPWLVRKSWALPWFSIS